MPRTSRKKSARIKFSPSRNKAFDPRVSGSDLNRLEFHRQALALMPDPDDKDPGVAVMVDDKGPALDVFNCNCDKSRKTTCAHVKMLAAVYRFKQSMLGNNTLEQDFRESVWQ